jgi:hypothetical protein
MQYQLIKELLETEEKYFEDLMLLVKWQKEIRKEQILNFKDIQLLFSNVELIKSLHELIISKIIELLSNYDPNQSKTTICYHLSNLFVQVVHLFQIYNQYTSNWQKSIIVLDENRNTNNKFKKYELQIYQQYNSLKFDDFLVKPGEPFFSFFWPFKFIFKFVSKNQKLASSKTFKIFSLFFSIKKNFSKRKFKSNSFNSKGFSNIFFGFN